MKLEYFLANRSGFESLKNSGYLNKLQGDDLELLVYQYYNLVDQIVMDENIYNNNLKDAKRNFQNANFDKKIQFFRPSYIDQTNGLTEINPYIKKSWHIHQLRAFFCKHPYNHLY
jgi:hypothetical protein